MDNLDHEILFVGTAEAEHVEMYLKAIWHIRERKEDVKISTIAKMLNVRQPSVVQMLKKLNEKSLVNYNKVVVAITDGELDFGPWEQIFYGEFDGRRAKRVLVKIIGE